MRVLITGISGFLGRHLASVLGSAGHEICGLGLGSADLPGVFYQGVDILNVPALKKAVTKADPDVVVHLAGSSHVGQSWNDMPGYFAANVLGVENVLEAASGGTVVLASSSEVYGNVPESEQPIPEDRMPSPRSPYALTKAAAERLVLGCGGIVARIFNLIGPGQAPAFALPSFARQLAGQSGSAGGKLKVGNLEARRDFVHVIDGAEALGLLVQKGQSREIYNIGSGSAISIQEALELLLRVSGVPAEIEVDPERLRPIDVPLLCADPSKLRALGWTAERGVNRALQDLWNSVAPSVVDRQPV